MYLIMDGWMDTKGLVAPIGACPLIHGTYRTHTALWLQESICLSLCLSVHVCYVFIVRTTTSQPGLPRTYKCKEI